MHNWQSFKNNPNILFHELPTENKITDIAFEEYIGETEKLLGQSIPEDYKTFCKIFGNVSINKFAIIYYPNFWRHRFAIDSCKDDIEFEYCRVTQKNRNTILSFIDHALWFGNTDRAELFLDLSVPVAFNKICPVYMIQRNPKKLHFISDSLFNFVTLFCCNDFVGKLPKSLLPKHRIKHNLKQFEFSFTKAEYEFGRDVVKSMRNQATQSYSDSLWNDVHSFRGWADDD